MVEITTTVPIKASTSTIFEDFPQLCRFCFGYILDDVPSIDIFTSKIGSRTIYEIVQAYFAVIEKTSYEQYLNGRRWNSDHLEVTSFELNNEHYDVPCICAACLHVIIESSWFAKQLRSHDLQSVAKISLPNALSKCTLIATMGKRVPNEIIMPSWHLACRYPSDDLDNIWDACIFCFEHNSVFLFDIFLSNVMGSNIADVIKTCSTTFKKQEIYEEVHLVKSSMKTINVVDFQWNISDSKAVPRKICLKCIIPMIKLKALIERIRKTNETLQLVKLTNKLEGSLEINIPYSDLQEILATCTFKTTEDEIISPGQIWKMLKQIDKEKEQQKAQEREQENEQEEEQEEDQEEDQEKEQEREQEKEQLIQQDITPITEALDSIAEMTEVVVSDYVFSTVSFEEDNIYCDYCKRIIYGCSSFEDHIIKSMKEDVVNAVKVHNLVLCDNCLDVVFKKKETTRRLPMKSFKNCPICKLSLYQTRDSIDNYLTYTEFLSKYFK